MRKGMHARKALSVALLAAFLGMLYIGGGRSPHSSLDRTETFQWFSTTSFWDPPEWSLEEDTVTGQISRETGVSFTYDIPEKNGSVQLRQMLVKDALPDVISTTDMTCQKQLVESGKVWDIQELLETYDPDSPLLRQFPEDVKKILIASEGGWYCYPSHIGSEDARKLYPPCDPYYWDLVYYQHNEGIMFNRALMERLGIEAEDLLEEEQVLEAFRRVRELDEETGEGLIPLLLNGKGYEGSSLTALSKSFGAKWIDGDGHYQDYYFTSQAKHAMEFLNQAYRNQCLDLEQLFYSVEEMQDKMKSGKVFCFIGNVADTSVDEREWEAGPILSSLGDHPAVQVSMQAQIWMRTYISKSCRSPQKIAQWLSFMAGEEGMRLNYMGMEGRDYVIRDGLMERTPEGLAGDHSAEKGYWIFWPFANTTYEKHVQRPPEEDSRLAAAHRVQTAMGRYPESELYEVALVTNLTADLDPEGDYGQLVNQINAYKKEHLVSLIAAANEEQFEKEYQKLLQGLEDLGLKKLDQILDGFYQERCERYGVTLEKDYKKSMGEEMAE